MSISLSLGRAFGSLFRRTKETFTPASAEPVDPWGEWEKNLDGGGAVVGGPSQDVPFVVSDFQARNPNNATFSFDGIHLEDFARRRNKRRDIVGPGAASAAGYQLPEGVDPATIDDPPDLSDQIQTRVITSGGGDQGGNPPIIESTQLRTSRGTQSVNYYYNDGVAHATLRTLFEYVIGAGFDVEVDYQYDEVGPWFKATNPEVKMVKQKYEGRLSKDLNRTIFLDYLNTRAERLKEDLDLENIAVHIAKDALTTGDAFGYRVEDIKDPAYENWEGDDREYLLNTLAAIQILNPLAVTLQVDEFNQLLGASIRPDQDGGGVGQPVPIQDLTKFCRMKWGGAPYTIYGVPHLTPALSELALKASLLRAAKASADRFAVPIRQLKFGVEAPGREGGPIASAGMRQEAVQALQQFNQETQVLVSPFHWEWKFIGAEGQVLDIADQIAECDRRIMMALGVPPNFLDSNYTSFATAKIQYGSMIKKLRSLQDAVADTIERDMFRAWARIRGYRGPDGELIRFKVRWKRGDIENDPELVKLIASLAKLPNQRLLSLKTMRETLGFSSETEEQQILKELADQPEGTEQPGQGNPGGESDNPEESAAPTGDDGVGEDAAAALWDVFNELEERVDAVETVANSATGKAGRK